MTLSSVSKRTIAKNTKEIREIVCVPNWRKHSFKQDDPTYGEPCGNAEILARFENKKFESCFVIESPPPRIIFQISSTLWYSTGVENLTAIRQKVADIKRREREIFWRQRKATIERQNHSTTTSAPNGKK